MCNMYTCIAYLSEIRKFCSKNVVLKGVNFEAQNALKVTYQQASRQQGHAKPASSRSGGPSERSKDMRNQPRVGPVDRPNAARTRKPASSRSGGPSERSKDTQNQPRVGPVDQRCFIQDIKSIL